MRKEKLQVSSMLQGKTLCTGTSKMILLVSPAKSAFSQNRGG
eukprot:UN20529